MPVVKFARFAPHICAFLASVGSGYAQSPRPEIFALHPKGGFLYSNNSVDFNVFQGLENYCEPYSSEFSPNFSAGLFGELPLFKNAHLGLGVGFTRRNSRFTSQKTYAERDTTQGQNKIVDVQYENEVLANLSYLEIQPEFRYTLLEKLFNGPLRSVAALRFSLPVTANYTQTDRIISPSNATFAADESGNRVREREITTGDLASKNSFAAGVSAGLENLLKVGENTHFTQQILFDYNFTNVLNDASWKQWAIRGELGLRFGFVQSPTQEKPIEIPPPVKEPVIVEEKPPVPAPPMLQLAITDVRATLQTGNELLASTPIVNAVFFEKSSADIPSRYRTSGDNSAESDAFAAHKNILLQIAQIVFKNPKAKIVLEGATGGTVDEPEGIDLARRRAEAVKSALKNLGVPDNSITTRQSVLPRNPSNQDYPTGREENRRVDIVVQNAPLQEYVSRQQFAQVKGELTADITAYNIPQTSPLELRTSCSMTPTQSNSAPGTKTISFLCETSPNQQALDLRATAFSSYAGKDASDSRSISIAALPKEQIDLKTDDFYAILRFDYNSGTLTPENKELLKQMSELLPAGATVTIYGSSDVTSGSEQRNAELSAARAKATEEFLKSIAGNKFTLETRTDAQGFSEETPEGRFLNRSIRVRVRR